MLFESPPFAKIATTPKTVTICDMPICGGFAGSKFAKQLRSTAPAGFVWSQYSGRSDWKLLHEARASGAPPCIESGGGATHTPHETRPGLEHVAGGGRLEQYRSPMMALPPPSLPVSVASVPLVSMTFAGGG